MPAIFDIDVLFFFLDFYDFCDTIRIPDPIGMIAVESQTAAAR